ncbi:MAG TPA: response regulator transcription factor [Chitinophagales bacterium]|nr:response regulator transcription factor [Chitinophagales bacterium]
MRKVLVVDDHKIINDGMRLLISSHEGFEVIGQCFNGKDAVDFIQDQQPDYIVMDVNMPVMDGMEATAAIKKLKPEIKIIVLSMVGDFATVSKMIESGADGYILKNTDSDEFFTAINTIEKGGMYLNPEINQVLLKGMKEQKDIHLTKREKEILKLVVEGLSTKQIADKLFLGEETVKSHRKNLMAKLNQPNVASLVKFAIERNLI